MELTLWHQKTPNYAWEKANPPSHSGVEPTAHLAPKKKPRLAKKIDEKNQIKEQAG